MIMPIQARIGHALPWGKDMKIDNIVALVTGANRGIGRALVEQLLAMGAARVYAAARDRTSLEPLIATAPGRVLPLRIDITDRGSVEAAAGEASDVRLLINNAGVLASGGLLDSDIESMRLDMDTNGFGTLNMVRAFAPILEANAPSAIVNLLSVITMASMPGLGGYCASKAALASMTQSLRAELAGRGIAVHGVFPGPIDTDMTKGFDMPKFDPADIAAAVLAAIESGDEDIFPDPFSREAHATWLEDPKELERQFGAM
jgi:NAD(P)-dependent dehydrogenase (short-subunit alcohol dehydrogenase family)